MGKRTPLGPVMVVTDQFRRDLAAWLAENHVSGTELARRIGASQPSVWALINNPDKVRTSDLVEPICRATGLPLPHPTVPVTSEDLEVLDRLHELKVSDPDKFEAIMLLLRKH